MPRVQKYGIVKLSDVVRIIKAQNTDGCVSDTVSFLSRHLVLCLLKVHGRRDSVGIEDGNGRTAIEIAKVKGVSIDPCL